MPLLDAPVAETLTPSVDRSGGRAIRFLPLPPPSRFRSSSDLMRIFVWSVLTICGCCPLFFVSRMNLLSSATSPTLSFSCLLGSRPREGMPARRVAAPDTWPPDAAALSPLSRGGRGERPAALPPRGKSGGRGGFVGVFNTRPAGTAPRGLCPGLRGLSPGGRRGGLGARGKKGGRGERIGVFVFDQEIFQFKIQNGSNEVKNVRFLFKLALHWPSYILNLVHKGLETLN